MQCKNSHGLRCIFTFHSTEQGRSGGLARNRVEQGRAGSSGSEQSIDSFWVGGRGHRYERSDQTLQTGLLALLGRVCAISSFLLLLAMHLLLLGASGPSRSRLEAEAIAHCCHSQPHEVDSNAVHTTFRRYTKMGTHIERNETKHDKHIEKHETKNEGAKTLWNNTELLFVKLEMVFSRVQCFRVHDGCVQIVLWTF